MNKTSNNYVPLYICLLLAVAALVVYWQVHQFDYVNFDDYGYVKENPHVKYGFSIDDIKWAFAFNGYASNWHPLTWLSHMLDCQLFGINAGAHHFVNLFFHIANTILLFSILSTMTGTLWRSLFVAAAFALHPLHVESVAWISERKDLLSTFFGLLTITAYYRYVKQPTAAKYCLSLVYFALALMSKPMLVTLPFVLLLLDYWPIERLTRNTFNRLVFEKTPFLALSVISSVITFVVQRKGGAVIAIEQLAFKDRIANAIVSYAQYIAKMFYPENLAIFYPHSKGNTSTATIIGAVVIFAAVTVLVICMAKKYKYLPVGWLWYFGMLVPVIGLVQVGGGAMADRYTYMPLTGLFIFIVWAMNDLLTELKFGKILAFTSAMIVFFVMSIYTFMQIENWRNSVTLFEHAIEATKDNYIAHQCLGSTFKENFQYREAIEHYNKALQIEKNFAPAYIGLGELLNDVGKSNDAIEYLEKAMELNPPSPASKSKIYSELGRSKAMTGKIREAVKMYEKAYQLEPDYPEYANTLAWYYATSGDDKIRNYAASLPLAMRVCEITRYSAAETIDTLAAAYAANGHFGKAAEYAEMAISMCQSVSQDKFKRDFENRLILYKKGEPYIENSRDVNEP